MSDNIRRTGRATDFDISKVEKTETVHHVSVKERRKKRGPTTVGQLNLTSMMDVTFQLLIFFVLTAKFVINEGIIPADLPHGEAKSETIELPRDPIVIHVRSVGDECSVTVGNKVLTGGFPELFTLLDTNRQDENNPNAQYLPDNPIVIRPHQKVRWKDVVDAFNQCVRAKYENVSFAQAAPR